MWSVKNDERTCANAAAGIHLRKIPHHRHDVDKIPLPQIVSIKQASEIMNLPPYYLRRVCRENPDLAFQSGVKWYINLGKLAAYYNNKTEQSE